MLAIFGRNLQTPADLRSWLCLTAVLVGIAVGYGLVGGRSTCALALIAGTGAYAVDGRLFVSMTIALTGGVALLTGQRIAVTEKRHRAVREGTLLATGFLLYEAGRATLVGEEGVALRNAHRILTVERRWDLAFEPALQRLVLAHERLLVIFNGIYSWGFFAFLFGILFWLYLADDVTYRLLRIGLGASALLALGTIALFPVAPPRLTPASGLVDSHALLGHGHGFVNPYAAMPSLHVGWTLLAGYALRRNLRSPIARNAALIPAALMMATVVVTGNHYWLDCLAGSIYALVPVMVIERVSPAYRRLDPRRRRVTVWIRSMRFAGASGWAIGSMLGLGLLLTYLVARQAIDPGFTHYWGYTVLQIAVTLGILFAVDVAFGAQGGLAWYTHLLVTIDTWADTMGTAGHLYDRFAVYDKFTHLLGGMALTAAAANILLALVQRGTIHWSLATRLAVAVTATMLLNVGWESYEYLGDVLLNTGRHQGNLDTTYDFLSDLAGALVVAIGLGRLEASAAAERYLTRSAVTHRGTAHHSP